jgi:type VI protein secretion system component VasK
MLSRREVWILTALAAALAALVAVNMLLFSENRKAQAEVSQRALFIQQSVPLETLSREIAVALAQLGMRSQDEQIRALLASLGIVVTVNPPPAPEPAPRPRGK